MRIILSTAALLFLCTSVLAHEMPTEMILPAEVAPSIGAPITNAPSTSCIGGTCQDIPIVESVPTTALLIGEFMRPQTTFDANGNATTQMVRVRRYSLQGTPYIPCGQ